MAGSIGPIAAGIAPSPTIRRDASRNAEPAPEAIPSTPGEAQSGAESLDRATSRPTGDGGTRPLSGPGAALVTIKRNVEGARQLVPTIAQVRVRIRVRNTELRQAQSAAVRKQFNESARAIVRTTPEAAPQLSRFFESNASPEANTASVASANEPGATETTDPQTTAVELETPTAPDIGFTNATKNPQPDAPQPAEAAPAAPQSISLNLLA